MISQANRRRCKHRSLSGLWSQGKQSVKRGLQCGDRGKMFSELLTHLRCVGEMAEPA